VVLLDLKDNHTKLSKLVKIVRDNEDNIAYTKWIYGLMTTHAEKYALLKQLKKPFIAVNCPKRLSTHFEYKFKDIAVSPFIVYVYGFSGCCMKVWPTPVGHGFSIDGSDILESNWQYRKEKIKRFGQQRLANDSLRHELVTKIGDGSAIIPKIVLDAVQELVERTG